MSNLLKMELFKLLRVRTFRVIILILMFFSFLYPLLMQYDTEIVKMPTKNEFFSFFVITFNNEIVKFFPSILAGFFITSEYSMGTMKTLVASGNGRVKVYFSKLIVFSIGTIIINLVLPIFMTITGLLFSGLSGSVNWLMILKSFGFVALYSSAFASIMALFAAMFTDNGKTIGFLLIFFMLISSILKLVGDKVQFLQTFFQHSVFLLVINISNLDQLTNSETAAMIYVPIITFIVFGVLGSCIFTLKEIK